MTDHAINLDIVRTSETEQFDQSGQIAAINKSQAVIEFGLDGIVQNANDNFLNTLGYKLDDIKGKHHRIFCDPDYVNSKKYQDFWDKMRAGQFDSGEYKRFAKNGKELWLQASYNPVFDKDGRPYKIVKFATDITAKKLENANFQGQMDAIRKSQAVIEFNLDGIIVDANDNFLNCVGYSLNEVVGKHHRMFCEQTYTASNEYRNFWEKLNRGEFDSGEYKRVGKGGKEIWLQASYNPVFDMNGRVMKVVKFAVDVSAQKLKDAQLEALSKAQAVIDFTPDGTILDANDNFLKTLGYRLDEIQGKHHSKFCTPELVKSEKYREFWHDLARGHFQSDQFPRVAKSGKIVWIQASYVPVFDLTGKVFKVVKYTSDITDQKNAQLEMLKTLSETSSQLAAAAVELNATATQMAGNAERTTEIANTTSVASEEVTQGVNSVATNTEEMSASIKEIARSAADVSTSSTSSLREAQATNATIAKLGESSQEIGNVIKVISSIAQQTNLLALNATIEAARAGDAGRGFAVVANEVKELAKQTAKATEDITNKVTGIQKDSANAVTAVAGIGQTIEKLNAIASSIAAAVEEQSATTNEVARIVTESAIGVSNISKNVKLVSSTASETNMGASQVMEAARSLSQLATRLETLVKSIAA